MKYSFLLFIFSLIVGATFGQEARTFFDKDWNKCDRSIAAYYRTVAKQGENFFVSDYYMNKNLQMTALCSEIEPELKYNGEVRRYNEKGMLIEISHYFKGIKYGAYLRTKVSGEDTSYTVYYLNGDFNYSYKAYYANVHGSVAPQYLGGSTAIAKVIDSNMKYPEPSKANRIGGKINVTFKIDTLGKISTIKVPKGINEELNAEATRLVGLLDDGNWVPATQAGKKIAVAYSVPIQFFPDEEYEKNYYETESKKNIYLAFMDLNRAIVDSNAASFYTVYFGNDEKYSSGTNFTYLMTGILLSEEVHHLNSEGKRESTVTYYHSNGKVRSVCSFVHNKKNGELKQYYFDGKKERIEKYEMDSLISQKCYTSRGTDTASFIRDQRRAQFPGGEGALHKFVDDNMVYPKKAKRRRISGKVEVKFIVDKYGNCLNVRTNKDANPILAKEALRVFNLMPKWEPGFMTDQLNSLSYTYPLNFKL